MIIKRSSFGCRKAELIKKPLFITDGCEDPCIKCLTSTGKWSTYTCMITDTIRKLSVRIICNGYLIVESVIIQCKCKVCSELYRKYTKQRIFLIINISGLSDGLAVTYFGTDYLMLPCMKKTVKVIAFGIIWSELISIVGCSKHALAKTVAIEECRHSIYNRLSLKLFNSEILIISEKLYIHLVVAHTHNVASYKRSNSCFVTV